jgi:hypothetical protein
MTRPLLVSLGASIAMCGAGIAAPEEVSPLFETSSTAGQISESPPPRARLVSPAMAVQLSAAVPRFEPTVTTTPVVKPEPVAFTSSVPKIDQITPAILDTPPTDLRKGEKSRGGIVKMPSVIVRDAKPLVVKPRELLTPQGRLDLALKKHPGVQLGSFWIFRNDGWALAMLEEEERLDQRKEMNYLISMAPDVDYRPSRAPVKPQIEQAFTRYLELK